MTPPQLVLQTGQGQSVKALAFVLGGKLLATGHEPALDFERSSDTMALCRPSRFLQMGARLRPAPRTEPCGHGTPLMES